VRRTLYGHFPNRQALLAALAEEATQAVGGAVDAARRPGDDPPTALARMALGVSTVGDRYRMLIGLGRRDLGEETVRAALKAARTEVAAILDRGQRDSYFPGHLPARCSRWPWSRSRLPCWKLRRPGPPRTRAPSPCSSRPASAPPKQPPGCGRS
jgi:AcrR family transcriptional regulator